MNIVLNNREEAIPEKEGLSVQELLDYKKFTFKFLVVRINGEIIKQENFGSRKIIDGDHVMVLHLISGG